MGRRHARHAFMPGKFVFPGGRTDPADSRIAVAEDLHPHEHAKLTIGSSRLTAARARAIALSAIRETYEEAGLLIGRKGAVRRPPSRTGTALPSTACSRRSTACASSRAPSRRPAGCAASTRASSPPGASDVAVALPDGGPTNELEETRLAADRRGQGKPTSRSSPRPFWRTWQRATGQRSGPRARRARCRSTDWSASASWTTCSDRFRASVDHARQPGILTAGRLHGTGRRANRRCPPATERLTMNGNPISESESGPEHTRWLSITAAIASISVVGIAIGLGMPLLSVILETRGHSATMIGLNTAVAGLASIAAAPLATPLAVRFGVVWTMLAMIVLGAFAFVGFYFATVVLDVVSAAGDPARRADGAVHPLRILDQHRRRRHTGAASCSASTPPCCRSASRSARGSSRKSAAPASCRSASPSGWSCSPRSRCLRPPAKARKFTSSDEPASFLRYIWLVPTATAAVLVFGAVETGGFALFPVYGNRIGYSEADAALLLTMIGLGNVHPADPDRHAQRPHRRPPHPAARLRDGRAFRHAGAAVVRDRTGTSWRRCCSSGAACVAALYTIGLAHLGSRLTGRELASANAAFVFCYGFGMLIGPQVIGIGMDAVRPRRLRLFAGAVLRALHRAHGGAHGVDAAVAPQICRRVAARDRSFRSRTHPAVRRPRRPKASASRKLWGLEPDWRSEAASSTSTPVRHSR